MKSVRPALLHVLLFTAPLLAACGGGSGAGADATTPPTLTFGASAASVSSGGTVTLAWSATDATGCSASGGWSGSKATTGSEASAALTSDTTFTLQCTGAGGTVTRSATVQVTSTTPAPTLTFSADPAGVVVGGASTLAWTTTNAGTCAASGGWSGARATSGTASTGALASTTTYTLACSGAGGTVTRSTTVTVTASVPAPTISLNATPLAVSSGGASTLTWSTTNASSCTASGGWTGAKATGGTQSSGALTSTTTFTLGCAGPGGNASASVTVTVATTAGPAFPLRTEAAKRYLVDANGNPFYVHGDTPWCLVTQLTREQVDAFLDDRKAQGFNTILVELMEHSLCANAPLDVYGAAPFTTAGDFATPNEAYFAHAAYVVAAARARGILVMVTPAYMGFGGGEEGWYQEMVANGPTKLRAYGQYVAQRFQAYDNLLWVQGGDYNPPDLSLLRAIPLGILDRQGKWLQTFHGSRGTSALGFLGTGESWLTLNTVYTDETTVVTSAHTEYNRTTMPFFLIEARYESEGAGTETVVRTQAYQTMLSGSTGHLYGNGPVWRFASGWETAVGAPGAATLRHLRTLFDALAWWTLVPDTTGTLLVGGTGSGSTRAAAARAAAGEFAVLYTPTVRGLTVALGRLAGPNVTARWFDPTSGTYTAVAGSPFAVTGGNVVFTPTGNNSRGLGDWVLLLESAP